MAANRLVVKNDLILGDCLSVMGEIEPRSVDAVIADLPYGTTNCSWDTIIPLQPLWAAYHRVLKENGCVVLFSAQPFTSILISSNLPEFRYCWYWEKEKGTGFLNAKKQPMRVVEEICVFYKTKCTYNPKMVPLVKPYTHTLPAHKSDIHNDVKSTSGGERTYKTYTHAYPKNVLKFPRDKANKSLVPTQKPLKLLEYLVETHTNPGDLVLDNTMGSGTTCLACKNLNRNYIDIEQNSKHYQIATARLNTA